MVSLSSIINLLSGRHRVYKLRSFGEFIFSENASSLVEDILLVGAIVIPLAILAYFTMQIIKGYFETFAFITSLPFP